jgi:hypothetical protein
MNYIILILFFIPILVFGQGGEIPKETLNPTPDSGMGSDSSTQATSAPAPISTLVPTVIPRTTVIQSSQPTPTPTPSVSVSGTPLPVLSTNGSSGQYNLVLYIISAIAGVLGILAVIKAKTKKKTEADDDRCGSIRELFEQKKKELEEYVRSLPEEKIKEFAKERVVGELKKDEAIKMAIETVEGTKEKYEKLKKAVELLEKQYNLCMLELPSVGKDAHLSYLMGGENIKDNQIKDLGIKMIEKDGDRGLIIPNKSLTKYLELIKNSLNPGFWNEVVGKKEIIFIFKFKDGTIKEFKLSPENEKEISQLCTQFNNDPIEKTANVYKYISGNGFYHDFMADNYKSFISRE